MRLFLLSLVAVACVAALLIVLARARQQEKEKGVVVLGEELLKAGEAEAQHQARVGAVESPVPAGEYGFRPEELGLINPRPQPLDDAISELCRRYAASDAAARARMRDAVSMEEFYKLLAFANRAAVFGLRERKAERVAGGLTAVAMIAQERVDFRDALVTLSLLHHSATRIGADAGKLFRDAAGLAEKETGQLILQFLSRPAREKDIRASWGFDEVETEGGVGFIGWEFEPYEPTYDLKRVAVEVARLVAADKYGPVSASVAAKLWPVWLQGADDAALERALGKARAGASVTGHLRPGEHPQHESQQFTVFLVELSDEASARTLLDLSRGRPPSDVASLGLAEGRLFCLVIARAFAEGARPFETAASLRRFSAGLSDILRRHTKP